MRPETKQEIKNVFAALILTAGTIMMGVNAAEKIAPADDIRPQHNAQDKPRP